MKRTFVETKDFQRLVDSLKEKDLLQTVQNEILKDPETGARIKGAGGIRKFRVGAKGKGTRGGIRVFYFDLPAKEKCYLLFILEKSQSDNISDEEKAQLRELVQRLKK